MKLPIFCLFFFSLHISINAQPAPCMNGCTALSIQDYKKGMRFYFPKDAVKEASSILLPDILPFFPCTPDTELKPVFYRNLATRTLQVDSVVSFSTPGTVVGTSVTYFIFLKDLACDAVYIYTPVIDLRMQDGKMPKPGVYTIPGAIYLPDVEWAKGNLLNKTVYSLFPIRGHRFTAVEITGVDIHSYETPLRIHFKADGIKDSTVDVVLCGTNVRQSFASSFHFSKFFQCDNPQGNINNTTWAMIQQGKVVLGMTKEQVELSLGKPQKVTETITAKETSVEYIYPSQKVAFAEGKVIKVETTS